MGAPLVFAKKIFLKEISSTFHLTQWSFNFSLLKSSLPGQANLVGSQGKVFHIQSEKRKINSLALFLLVPRWCKDIFGYFKVKQILFSRLENNTKFSA
jgi:hypothetical protein